jgi:hypothetical protein
MYPTRVNPTSNLGPHSAAKWLSTPPGQSPCRGCAATMAESAQRPTDRDHALPNGTERTYLSGAGAVALAGAFLVFLAVLL